MASQEAKAELKEIDAELDAILGHWRAELKDSTIEVRAHLLIL